MTIALAGELECLAAELRTDHMRATVSRWACAVRTGRADYARLVAEEIWVCGGHFPPELRERLADVAVFLRAVAHENVPDGDPQRSVMTGTVAILSTARGIEVTCLLCGTTLVLRSRRIARWVAWHHNRRRHKPGLGERVFGR